MLIVIIYAVRRLNVLVLSSKLEKYLFNEAMLLSLYNSLILPYVSYCIHVWGRAYDTHLKLVLVLQNKAVRVIAGVSSSTNVDICINSLIFFQLERSLFTLAVYSCRNTWIECVQNYSRICLLLSAIFITMIHGKQWIQIYLFPSHELLETNNPLLILGPMYGI